jgi:hypothetical protein
LISFRWVKKPNAAAQARQTAGARHERTLFAVACSRLLGGARLWEGSAHFVTTYQLF